MRRKAPWMPDKKRCPKGRRFFGVFPHAIKCVPTGRGYVVREVDENGEAKDVYNYGGLKPLNVYRSEKVAYRSLPSTHGHDVESAEDQAQGEE